MDRVNDNEASGEGRGQVQTEGVLNYIVRGAEKPIYYAGQPPLGQPQHTGEFVARTVPINDARSFIGEISLDKQGFQLEPHQTAVVDFYDRDEVERVYYPEVEELLKRATGAEKVVIFDHQVRNLPMSERGERNARGYAKMVHNDYTAKSGPRRVRDHLPPGEAAERLQHRFAEINVWRPIAGPIKSSPLAVCDAKSIDPDDFVASDLVYPDKVGETYRFTYNPNHRWFYYPNLQRDEAILLKCYDSKEDGRARFTAHTSFDDPSSGPDAPARESIEVRALVFWAPGAED
ncbi:MAG: CmcJ/NvfI family oxidoreductase [Candidatus Binataceae bacterium]|jgi:hypothetical protein